MAEQIGTPSGAVLTAPLDGIEIGRSDPRYQELAARGYNLRFAGQPDRIWLVRSAEDVIAALEPALRAGTRVAVRSGGHCLQNFVDDPQVREVIDMSAMTRIGFDRERRAFVVETGARLDEVYRKLHLGWGVTIPAGENPEVGVGGHVPGGGHGVLCRRHGLVVDHLEAVEVVVADRSGQARCVVATRDPSDPNHELWWAHTGAGGGNFGVVTRYWFRSPGVDSTDPARLLPAPPASVLRFAVDWRWAGMDECAFTRLVRNHGRWFEDHGAPDSPYAGMYSELYLQRQPLGWHYLIGQLPDGPDAQRLLDDFVAALGDGVGAPQRPVRVESRPWVSSAISGLSNERGVRRRAKIKSGYLRRSFTDRQIAALYRHLTRSDSTVVAGMVTVMAYGGAVNSVPPAATATAQRDSVMKLSYLTVWSDPAEDGEHLSWLRELYRDVYADTGGVPVPGDVSDGAYINYPDVDLADPRWNTSGVGWHTLYYKDNYTRLQQVKARWDPGDVFRHALSVRPA